MSYPKRYIPKSLSKRDRAKQKRELNKSRRAYRTKRGKSRYHSRPKMKSFKSKESGWTKKFHDKYPEAKTYLLKKNIENDIPKEYDDLLYCLSKKYNKISYNDIEEIIILIDEYFLDKIVKNTVNDIINNVIMEI